MDLKLEVMTERIKECKTIGELEFIENIFKNDFKGINKVDFETEILKKFQELRE